MLTSSSPNSGPGMGPVVGGIVAQLAGWPWIFWLLSMLGGFCLVLYVLFFPETCRTVVGNGTYTAGRMNKPLAPFLRPSKQENPPPDSAGLSHKFRRVPNPFKCFKLLVRKHDFLIMAPNALFYISYSCFQAGLSPLLIEYYGLDALQSGLCYLSYGIATISSSYGIGMLFNQWDVAATCGLSS
jgi:MFS family permease